MASPSSWKRTLGLFGLWLRTENQVRKDATQRLLSCCNNVDHLLEFRTLDNVTTLYIYICLCHSAFGVHVPLAVRTRFNTPLSEQGIVGPPRKRAASRQAIMAADIPLFEPSKILFLNLWCTACKVKIHQFFYATLLKMVSDPPAVQSRGFAIGMASVGCNKSGGCCGISPNSMCEIWLRSVPI